MIKKLIAITSATFLASYGYAKILEKRSYSSFLYEIMFRITNMKRTFMTVEAAQQALKQVENTTKAPYKGTSYDFNNEVLIEQVHGSTVYVINQQQLRQQPVILYLHGGAWFQNPLKQHFEYIDLLASTMDAKVIMPIYPKIPHGTYQDTFDLLEALYSKMLHQVEHSHQLTIMGDSAGGQLTLSFAQYLKQLQLPQPSNLVLLSPVLDATFSNPQARLYEHIDPMLGIDGSKFFLKLWADSLPLSNWKVSPINGDLADLGHITISIGTKETLYPDAVKLSNMLNEQNITHDFLPGYKLFHIHQIFPIPERQQLLVKLKNIISKH